MELQSNENKRNGQDKVIIILVLLVLLLFAGSERLLVRYLNGSAPAIAQAQKEVDAAKAENETLYSVLQEAKATLKQIQEENPVQLPSQVQKRNGQIDLLNNRNGSPRQFQQGNNQPQQSRNSQFPQFSSDNRQSSNGSSPRQSQQGNAQLSAFSPVNPQSGSELDSLRMQNSLLSKQFLSTKEELNNVKGNRDSLAKQNYKLGSRISMSGLLATKNLSGMAVRFKPNGEEVEVVRANFTEKLKFKFTIAENDLAKAGTKTIYIRIVDPAGNAVTLNDDFIMMDGIPTAYTFKQLIRYNNQDTPVTIFWAKNGIYPPGTYMAEVIVDGHLIGNIITTLR